MIQVSVTLRIDIHSGGRVWQDSFHENESVDYIIYDGDQDGWTDLTVYFEGDDEPFPITSLRQDSKIKTSILAILGD